MLKASLKISPDGAASRDAEAFLKELVKQYDVDDEEMFDTGEYGVPEFPRDAAFLNQESYDLIIYMKKMLKKHNHASIIKRVQAELDNGNYTVTVLSVGLLFGIEEGDEALLKKNVEGFDLVEDYTLNEIRAMGLNFDSLNRDDVAYDVYCRLYAKESGEKEIAYAFAVACAKTGKNEQALSIIDDVIASCGGFGVAAQRRNALDKSSYVFSHKKLGAEELQKRIEHIYDSSLNLMEAFDYLRFADADAAEMFFAGLNIDDTLTEEELRRLAVENDASLFIRSRAAKLLAEHDKKMIYLNTGADIIEFRPEIDTIILDMMERIPEK